jgi:putative endonuclease
MKGFDNTRAKGNHGEHLALSYLVKGGLRLIEQNFNSRYGEIDIIMHDADEWVFVEVRLRESLDFGGGLESVTRSKQQKLINTAEYYMQKHHNSHFDSCRFDIIEISGKLNEPRINWIKNAFWAD